MAIDVCYQLRIASHGLRVEINSLSHMSQHFKSNCNTDALLEKLFSEKVDRVTLDNGLTVVFKEDRTADLASVQVWVKTGSIHEGPLMGAGVSHYLEHMLFKGTERRSSQGLTKEIHEVGGYVNAYTTYDRTVYYIDVPSEAIETAVDILADMSFSSALAEEEVTRERDVILREIDMGMDDPDRQSFYAFTKMAFREHPYRYPVIGIRSLYEQVTPDELRGYYNSRYAPNNMVLVVVGAISFPELKDMVDKHFASKPLRRLPSVYVPQEPGQMAPREARLHGDYNIVRGMIGYKIPGLNHEDSSSLDILSSVLGQGQSAILTQRLREELRLVHQIDTSCWNPGSQGLFWVSYICDPGKREAVDEAIYKTLDEVAKEGVDPKLLEKAVRQATVGEINVRKTMSGQASRLGTAEVVVGDIGYPKVCFNRLSRVKPDDVTDMISKYLKPSTRSAVSLEPEVKGKASIAVGSAAPLADFEEVRFDNGARILMQPTPSFPKLHVRVVMLGGPLFEEPSQRGITGVLATLLTKDTNKRTAREVAEAVEQVGGSFSEFAGNNTFGLSMEMLSDDFDLAVDVIEQALLARTINETIFNLECEGQIASIREEDDEIVDYGKKHLRKKFFGDSGYGIDAMGKVECLEEITVQDIEALAEQLIVGPNVVISIGGSFDREQVLEQFGGILKKLPKAEFKRNTSGDDTPKHPGSFVEPMEREQAVVFQAYPDVGISDENYYTSELLDELFSGMSSNLFLKVREEKGLAYYVGSSRIVGIDTGMFYFYGGTQPSQAEDVLTEIDAEIVRVQKGEVTAEEIKACQTRLKVQKRMSMQPVGTRAMNAALNTLYGLPLNGWKDYDKKIDVITAGDLQAFAKKYFSKEKEVRLVVKAKAEN